MKNKFESVRDELIYLAKKNKGILNPHKVVDFAIDENTHLHSRFEWDDSTAANEYRLWQARKIISLEFEIIQTDKGEAGETRLFVSLVDDRKPGGGYKLITNVLNNDDERKLLLQQALSELIRIKAKYATLNELASIFDEVEKAQLKINLVEV